MTGKWTVVALIDPYADRSVGWSVKREDEWRTREWWKDGVSFLHPRFTTRAAAQREANRRNNADEHRSRKAEAP